METRIAKKKITIKLPITADQVVKLCSLITEQIEKGKEFYKKQGKQIWGANS